MNQQQLHILESPNTSSNISLRGIWLYGSFLSTLIHNKILLFNHTGEGFLTKFFQIRGELIKKLFSGWNQTLSRRKSAFGVKKFGLQLSVLKWHFQWPNLNLRLLESVKSNPVQGNVWDGVAPLTQCSRSSSSSSRNIPLSHQETPAGCSYNMYLL